MTSEASKKQTRGSSLAAHLGLAIALLGPLLYGFMTVQPEWFFAFASLFFLSHIVLRPYDLPRGMAMLQNTGLMLLMGRAFFSVGQAGVALLVGMTIANFAGFPFRAMDVPGRPDLSLPGLDLSTGALLSITLGISLVGTGLARLGRTDRDLFGSRRGIIGIGEAFDRFMTGDFSARAARLHRRPSPPGESASMVMIRPWALHSFRNQNSPGSKRSLVSKIGGGGHQKRLAHVLADAAMHGNEGAENALQALLSLPEAEDLRSDPEFSDFR